MTVSDKTQAAIQALYEAHRALLADGWREINYAPKDGTVFEAIEPGSTGIHDTFWMDCSFWVPEAGDAYPSRPILWRLKPGQVQQL